MKHKEDKTKRKSGGATPVVLPLKGRRMYLDLKGYRPLAALEQDLQTLGAVVEKCFSKDVNILITSKGSPKDYDRSKGGRDEGRSPTSPATPSPFSVPVESPQQHSPGSSDVHVKPLTRGQKLARFARGKQCSGSTDIVECAKRWKVKVVHIEVAQKWIKKEILKLPPSVRDAQKSSTPNKKRTIVRHFKTPYVKFESVNRHYRSLWQELEAFPEILWNTPAGQCPFETYRGRRRLQQDVERAEVEERDPRPHEGASEHKNSQELSNTPNQSRTRNTATNSAEANDRLLTPGEQKRRKAKHQNLMKKGHCEMCNMRYDDIAKHVVCDTHKKFVRDSANYSQLDAMIIKGHSMEQFLHNVLRTSATEVSPCVEESDSEVILLSESSYRTSPRTPQSRRSYTALKKSQPKLDVRTRNQSVIERIVHEFHSDLSGEGCDAQPNSIAPCLRCQAKLGDLNPSEAPSSSHCKCGSLNNQNLATTPKKLRTPRPSPLKTPTLLGATRKILCADGSPLRHSPRLSLHQSPKRTHSAISSTPGKEPRTPTRQVGTPQPAVGSPQQTFTPRRLKLLLSPCKVTSGEAGRDRSPSSVKTASRVTPGKSRGIDPMQAAASRGSQEQPASACTSPQLNSTGIRRVAMLNAVSALKSCNNVIGAGNVDHIGETDLGTQKSPAKSSRSCQSNASSSREFSEKVEQSIARVLRNKESVKKPDSSKLNMTKDHPDCSGKNEAITENESEGCNSQNLVEAVCKKLSSSSCEKVMARRSHNKTRHNMTSQESEHSHNITVEPHSGVKLPQFTLLSAASGTLRKRVRSNSSSVDTDEVMDVTETPESIEVTTVTPSTGKSGKQNHAKSKVGIEVTPVSSRKDRRRGATPQTVPFADAKETPAVANQIDADGFPLHLPVFNPSDIDDGLLAALLADSESMLGRRQTRALATTDMNDGEARQRFLDEIKQSQAQIYRVATSSANNSPSHHPPCFSSPIVTRCTEPRRATQSARPALSKERAQIRPTNSEPTNQKIAKSPEVQRTLRKRPASKNGDSQVTESCTASGRVLQTRSTHISPQDLRPADIERVTKEINQNRGPGGTNVYQEEVSNNTSRFWFYVPVSPENDPEASASDQSDSDKESEKESELSSEEEEVEVFEASSRRLRRRVSKDKPPPRSNNRPPPRKSSRISNSVLVEENSDAQSDDSDYQRVLRCRSSTASYSSSLQQALYSSQSPCLLGNSSEIAEVGSIVHDRLKKLKDVATPSPGISRRARFWSYEAVEDVNINPEEGEVLPSRTRGKTRHTDGQKSMDPFMKEICSDDYMSMNEEADCEAEPSHDERVPKRQSRRCRTEATRHISRLLHNEPDDEVFIQKPVEYSEQTVQNPVECSEGMVKEAGRIQRRHSTRQRSERSQDHMTEDSNQNQSQSDDSGESDAEDASHAEEVHQKSKIDGSRFWYYAPVHDHKEDDDDDEVVLTSASDIRGSRRRSQQDEPTATETTELKTQKMGHSKRGSKFWYYTIEAERGSADSEPESDVSFRHQRSTRRSRADTTDDAEPAVKDYQRSNANLDTEKHPQKGSSRFWHYVPEEKVSMDEEEEMVNVPRRTRAGRLLSTTESDNESCTSRNDEDCQAQRMTSARSTSKASKFWYYEPVGDDNSQSKDLTVREETISKEEQNSGEPKQKSSRPESRRKSRFWSYEEVPAKGNDTSVGDRNEQQQKSREEKQEQLSRKKSKFWHYEAEPTYEDTDEGDESCSSMRRTRRTVNRELRNAVDESTDAETKDDEEGANKSENVGRSRRKKFWHYVPVADEESDGQKEANTTLGRTRQKPSQKEPEGQERGASCKSGTASADDAKPGMDSGDQKGSESDNSKSQPLGNSHKSSRKKFYEYMPVCPENTKSLFPEEVILEGPRRSRKSINYAENISHVDVKKSVIDNSVKTVTGDFESNSSGKTRQGGKPDGVEKRDPDKCNTDEETNMKLCKNKKQRRSKEKRYWFFVVESKDMTDNEKETPVILDRTRTRGTSASSQERNKVEEVVPDNKTRGKSSGSSSKENQHPNVESVAKIKKHRRVKLKKKWELASNRSVHKLLSGGGNQEADFEGFPDNEVNGSTLTDQNISYDEVSEVEVSDTSEVEWEVEDEETQKEQDVRRFQAAVPFVNDLSKFLGSPTRRDDDSSDWDDNLEGFVEGQVNQRTETGGAQAIPLNFARITPRKKATPRKFLTPQRSSGKHRVSGKTTFNQERTPLGNYSGILDSSHLLDISTTGIEDELWVGPVPNDKSKYAKEGTIYKPSTPLAASMEGREATPKSYLRTPATPGPSNIMAREKQSVLEALSSTPIHQGATQSASTPVCVPDQLHSHTSTPARSSTQLSSTTPTGHSSHQGPESDHKASPAVTTSDCQDGPPEGHNSASGGRRLLKHPSNVKKQFNMTHLPSHAPNRPTTWTNKAASPSSALRGVALSPLGAWNAISPGPWNATSPKHTPPKSKQANQAKPGMDQRKLTPSNDSHLKHTPLSGKHNKPISPRKSSALPSWMMAGTRRSPRKLSMEGENVLVHRNQRDTDEESKGSENTAENPAKRKKSQAEHMRKRLCLSPAIDNDPLSSRPNSASTSGKPSGGLIARKVAENTYEFDDTNENDPYSYD